MAPPLMGAMLRDPAAARSGAGGAGRPGCFAVASVYGSTPPARVPPTYTVTLLASAYAVLVA